MVLVSTSKKNFQLKFALSASVLALAPCFLFYAPTAVADDSWQNLKHVTHERYYTVVDRKSNCTTGHIVKTNDHELTLKLPNRTYATFDRASVLRVSVSQAGPYLPPHVHADVGRVYDAVYNEKSSWSDLKRVAGEEVKVVKTDGETYEGRLLITFETQIELDRKGGKLEIAKVDIAGVYHLRPKPLTDDEKYSAQEDFWIDPRLWPYYLHLVPRLPVRLYDASLPDDNTPVRCENDSKGTTGIEYSIPVLVLPCCIFNRRDVDLEVELAKLLLLRLGRVEVADRYAAEFRRDHDDFTGIRNCGITLMSILEWTDQECSRHRSRLGKMLTSSDSLAAATRS